MFIFAKQILKRTLLINKPQQVEYDEFLPLEDFRTANIRKAVLTKHLTAFYLKKSVARDSNMDDKQVNIYGHVTQGSLQATSSRQCPRRESIHHECSHNFIRNQKSSFPKITKVVLQHALQLVASNLPVKVAPCDWALRLVTISCLRLMAKRTGTKTLVFLVIKLQGSSPCFDSCRVLK